MKGKLEGFWPAPNPKDLQQVVDWVKEGKIKTIIDQKFSFEDAIMAIGKLKSGRAKGKIVIDVASETYKNTWSN